MSDDGAATRPRRDTSDEPASESLSVIVHRLRRAAGLTLQELSARCDVAASTLSKIENNQVSPTYDTILRLAHGLGIDVAELFVGKPMAGASGRRTVTLRRQGVKQSTRQYEYEMLCAEIARKQFIPLLTTVRAHSLHDFPALVRHPGEEFIYILSGQVTLHTDHYAPTVLVTGDSAYFDSTMGHACVSTGDEDASMLWICSQVQPPLSD